MDQLLDNQARFVSARSFVGWAYKDVAPVLGASKVVPGDLSLPFTFP